MADTGGSWRPPRPCEDYWGEWKHCRGLRHAFHHYYAHGELPACGRWREDYEACRAWERHRTAAAQEELRRYRQKLFPQCPETPLAAAPRTLEDSGLQQREALCKSERARVMERQKYAPVWTLRKSPPPDWYLPLDQDKPN